MIVELFDSSDLGSKLRLAAVRVAPIGVESTDTNATVDATVELTGKRKHWRWTSGRDKFDYVNWAKHEVMMETSQKANFKADA